MRSTQLRSPELAPSGDLASPQDLQLLGRMAVPLKPASCIYAGKSTSVLQNLSKSSEATSMQDLSKKSYLTSRPFSALKTLRNRWPNSF
mmetsp:Transcript_43038/g.113414  ORF Transcript_43038/g.113414 Transcript_43038/m.113414 type:complete len:89 (+) Transcript_43038:117-383(+)